jgi:hypothetical protein
MTDINKHSSLPHYMINYDCKKFYETVASFANDEEQIQWDRANP